MKKAEQLLKQALCAAKMLESDLFRHRSMLDVGAGDAERIRDRIVSALAILEPSYRGQSFRVTDAVNFDEHVTISFPKKRKGSR